MGGISLPLVHTMRFHLYTGTILCLQHQGNYNAGDKVWYQYKDGNAWYGPAEVIYHKGNTIFIHGNGDVKKVAACKVKPYDPKEGEDEPQDEGEKSPEPV